MITDHAIDQALIELMRTIKALEALRLKRKQNAEAALARGRAFYGVETKEHAAAKRASLDLTRKLADLRAGR